jgi:hypothetical protein
LKKQYFLAAEIAYRFLRQRHQIFAELLSPDFEVKFIERVPSRFPPDIIWRGLRNFTKGLSRASIPTRGHSPGVEAVFSYMLPSINSAFDLYNQFRASHLLNQARKGDVFHLFANSPVIAEEAKKRGCLVIFDIIHNWWNFPYHQKIQLENVRKNLFLADIILSDSPLTLELAKKDLGKVQKRMKLINPGVEEFWFIDKPKFRLSERVHIVFFGNLRANSDVSLILKLLQTKHISVTLFGLLDSSLKKCDLKVLSKFYKGQLPAPVLAEQVRSFDMVLLPYDRSAFSNTIFPAKYYEVLALGKPVISDSAMLHLPGWSDFIWTSEDLEIYGPADLISKHYSERYTAQVDLARRNRWDHRVADLKKLIDGYV